MGKCPKCHGKLPLSCPKCNYCQITYCWACRLPEIHGCQIKQESPTINSIRGYTLERKIDKFLS